MEFRFGLRRLFVGVGLAAIPVAVFGNVLPVGVIAGCAAGGGLLVLSLTFERKHVRPVAVVLVCQVIGMFLSQMLAPFFYSTRGTSEVAFFSLLFIGALFGGLYGMVANASSRRELRRAQGETSGTRDDSSEEEVE